MQSFSILDNMLGAERAERLVVGAVSDLCSCLEQKCPVNDEERTNLLEQVMNQNPGIIAVNAMHDDAMYELTVRVVQDLDWKWRNGSGLSGEMKQAIYELALYLANWLQEKAEMEDAEEEEEYNSLNEEDADF